MLLHPDWETTDTSTVGSMGGGGAALQPDLVEKIDEGLERMQRVLPELEKQAARTAGVPA